MDEARNISDDVSTGYNPPALLELLKDKLELKNDAQLSVTLQVPPPVISKVRHRRMPVSSALLLRMHEVSSMSIQDLRLAMGDTTVPHFFDSGRLLEQNPA